MPNIFLSTGAKNPGERTRIIFMANLLSDIIYQYYMRFFGLSLHIA